VERLENIQKRLCIESGLKRERLGARNHLIANHHGALIQLRYIPYIDVRTQRSQNPMPWYVLGHTEFEWPAFLTNARLSDGGDARCMSQLYILGEYMHRLEYKLGKKLLPCEHFDLISAVDSSRQVIYPANLLIRHYN